jgi:hypothetical protein
MTASFRFALVATVAAASLGAPSAAFADDGACADDRSSFCSGVDPGETRVYSCLKSHWGELKQACRDELDRVASATELFNLQCQPEIFQYCRGVPSGKGQTLACLKSNAAKLSATCKAAVDGAKIPE